MGFAAGAFKKLSINEEVTFGTLVAAGGQYLDRVESTVDLTKDTYKSNAIRTDQQKTISRHGMRKVGGNIKGELNPGAYKRVMQALVRKDFAAGASIGPAITLGASSGVGFTDSGNGFLTAGFKVGSVIQPSGFVATVNDNRRYLVTSVTAGALGVVNLDGTAATITTEAAGASVTISEVGKVTYVPSSGHTDKSFTIEHWFSDIAQSEAFEGCKFSSMDIALPTTGLCTVDFSVMGKDILRATAQQMTTPTAAVSGSGLGSVNGVILVQGAVLGILNSLSFKVDGQMQVDGVVGANTTPNVWPGPLVGTGSLTAFFENATLRDYFIDEVEIGIIAVMTTSNVAAPDFLAFSLPRVKLNGATKDDKETGGIKLTGTIEFLRNTAGGAGTSSEDTTIRIQDSLA